MWMAFAAPALADNDRYDDNRIHNWWLDNDKRHDDYWFDYDGIILVSDNDFDDFYPYPYWGFYPYWGWDGGCGFDWGGPVEPYDCWD
jgi:hypothetical protein